MILAGEVVHGRTDNGPKDGVHAEKADQILVLINLRDGYRLKACRYDEKRKEPFLSNCHSTLTLNWGWFMCVK